MKLILLVGLFLLTSNAKASGQEILMGYIYDQSGITLQVATGGCTKKDSFQVRKEILNSQFILTFYRRQPDTCLALFRYGTRIRFSYEELGLGFQPRFKIRNTVDASLGGLRIGQ